MYVFFNVIVCVYVCVFINENVNVCVCVCVCVYVNTNSYVSVLVCLFVNVYACMHTRKCTLKPSTRGNIILDQLWHPLHPGFSAGFQLA